MRDLKRFRNGRNLEESEPARRSNDRVLSNFLGIAGSRCGLQPPTKDVCGIGSFHTRQRGN